MNSFSSNNLSLKYQRYAGLKDIGIRMMTAHGTNVKYVGGLNF